MKIKENKMKGNFHIVGNIPEHLFNELLWYNHSRKAT
jgi:hypothetical protein